MPSPLEAALARHRLVSIAAMTALVLLAWAWLLAGAGMDVSVDAGMGEMDGMAGMDMPGMAMDMAPQWSPAHYGIVFAMWWIMMVAMMLPSAAPTILLYARVAAHTPEAARPATGSFLAGYLAVWGVFAFLAASAQFGLERLELVSHAMMASQDRTFAGAILVAAGIYQLSPLKNACLDHCRSPARFLSSHYRPGALGAFRMGALHGAICVGCCWLLMALLFVGGVMNLVWIAVLSLMVAAEKLLPFGRPISIAAGLICLAWGTVTMLG